MQYAGRRASRRHTEQLKLGRNGRAAGSSARWLAPPVLLALALALISPEGEFAAGLSMSVIGTCMLAYAALLRPTALKAFSPSVAERGSPASDMEIWLGIGFAGSGSLLQLLSIIK